MNDLPGRGDVNPYGIPMPNPHEREGPDDDPEPPDMFQSATDEDASFDEYGREMLPCHTCGETLTPNGRRCDRCRDSMEYDRLEREAEYAEIARARIAWWEQHPEGMELVQRLNAEAERKAVVDAGQLELL